MSKRGTLYANDGVVTLGCRDGLRYSFYFGQLVGDAAVVSRLDARDPMTVRDYRYCFVHVDYAERLDWRTDTEMTAAERKADGQKRAQALKQRRAWFYIIDDIDFRAVSVLPKDLHRAD